jgi:hypothetical protein
MTRPGEVWLFRVEVPAGEGQGVNLVRSWLKYGWRVLGLRCVAVLEAPADPEAKGEDR